MTGTRQQTNLDGRGGQIFAQGLELCDKLRQRDGLDGPHGAGVLCRHRRYHTAPMSPQIMTGQQIGLQARPAAAVRAGDRPDDGARGGADRISVIVKPIHEASSVVVASALR